MHIGGMSVQGGPQHIAHPRTLSTKKDAGLALHRVSAELGEAGSVPALRAPAQPEQSCFEGEASEGAPFLDFRRGPLRLIRRRALDHVLAALEVAVPHRAVEIDRGLLEALIEIQ